MYYLWTCGSFKSANHKKITSANCKFASSTFAEGLQIKFVDLRFAELI